MPDDPKPPEAAQPKPDPVAAARAEEIRTADEAERKVAEAAAALERVKAEAPAVNDLTAAVRAAQERLDALDAQFQSRTQREVNEALVRHVRSTMGYVGSLDDSELLAILPKGVDPASKEGAERLEAFREKHMRDFRARAISPERLAADARTRLEQNEKIKNNPFFNIERAMRSLGRGNQ